MGCSIISGDFLNTEMDFLYQRARQLATNLPVGDTRLQGFRITADQLANSPLAPNLLPVLMHSRLFGIPLEFFNFLLALFVYSCAYPAVFWRVSKAFTCLFSFQLAIHSITLVLCLSHLCHCLISLAAGVLLFELLHSVSHPGNQLRQCAPSRPRFARSFSLDASSCFRSISGLVEAADGLSSICRHCHLCCHRSSHELGSNCSVFLRLQQILG